MTPASSAARTAHAQTLLLVGNPNVGKSVFFGALTGRYVNVSNYPGTTIEVTRGSARFATGEFSVVDTPGVNRLTPHSEDERVTRDLLLESNHASILQVADTKNLPRALLLTAELAELEVPVTLALNMQDEARERGVVVDRAVLTKRLGVPVIETIAIAEGTRHEVERGIEQSTPLGSRPEYPPEVEAAIRDAADRLSVLGWRARFVAVQLLSGDRTIDRDLHRLDDAGALPDLTIALEEVRQRWGSRHARAIEEARHAWVREVLAGVYSRDGARADGWAAHVSRWALHPLRGLLVLGAMLYATLWFVGLVGAGTLVDLMENGLFGQVLNPIAIRLADAVLPFPHEHVRETVRIDLELPLTPAHSLPLGLGWERTVEMPAYALGTSAVTSAPAAGFAQLVHDFLVGPYGVLTMAVSYGIAIVLPIVLTFFLVFSVLEDSGYLPRLAVLLHRTFRLMGLNGKAVLPMVLGLGCDTMATMTARILETRKQRLIVTLLLALAVPCSAQLGVLLAMMTAVSAFGALLWVGVVVAVMLLVGALAARLFPGQSGDFVLEIPPVRRPVLRNIVIKTTARLDWYLREVVPLFILGTVLLFVLDRTGALVLLRDFASPVVVRWLGLPIETTDAFIVGFLRRDYGAVLLLQAGTGDRALLDAGQVLVCMVVITLFVPCVANVFMIAKEHGWRTATAMSAFIFPFAFFVGGCLRLAIRAFHLPV